MHDEKKEIERWLDQKKESDLIKSVYITDPYVTKEEDIFDEYRENEADLDELFDEVVESGVDTREQEY
jgi:hypothetical protein